MNFEAEAVGLIGEQELRGCEPVSADGEIERGAVLVVALGEGRVLLQEATESGDVAFAGGEEHGPHLAAGAGVPEEGLVGSELGRAVHRKLEDFLQEGFVAVEGLVIGGVLGGDSGAGLAVGTARREPAEGAGGDGGGAESGDLGIELGANRSAGDVGFHLVEQGVTGEAAAELGIADGCAELFDGFDDVLERKTEAFVDGPGEIGAGGLGGEAVESAGGCGVPDGGAGAGKERQKGNAVGSGGRGKNGLIELGEGTVEERLASPFEDTARHGRRPAEEPSIAVGNGEDPALRIDDLIVGEDAEGGDRAGDIQGVAGFEQTGTEVGGGAIVADAEDWGPGAIEGRSDDGAGVDDTAQLEEVTGGIAVAGEGGVTVEGRLSGKKVVQVAGRVEQQLRVLEVGGFVIAKVVELREEVAGVGAEGGLLILRRGLDGGELDGRAAVAVEDGGTEGFVIGIEADEAGERGRRVDGRDGGLVDVLQGSLEGPSPDDRVLLGDGAIAMGFDGAGVGELAPAVAIDKSGAEALGAEVKD